MPLKSPGLNESFYVRATEKTFQDGVFGLDNDANSGAHSAKEIKRSAYPYWVTSLLLMLRKLFPPYRDMQLIPWYSFVDGRPWLMPFAWVYRWIYCFIHKRQASTALLIEPIQKKKIIQSRQEFIRDWGL